MKSYLLEKQSECPSNVDVVCTLASVYVELRDEEFDYIKFLQDFFNDTATTEIYTLSLHDALPIYCE